MTGIRPEPSRLFEVFSRTNCQQAVRLRIYKCRAENLTGIWIVPDGPRNAYAAGRRK